MKFSNKKLGKLIELTEEKNHNNAFQEVKGINIDKNFIKSVANLSKTDLSKYKVIRKGHFACNIMHVGRDERLPIALYEEDYPTLVSPAYKTFKVNDDEEVSEYYLMMVFSRKEFDRLTWFFCDSSIRGGLDWERFCDIEIPLPSYKEQLEIVSIYKGLLSNQKSYFESLDILKSLCNLLIYDQIKKGGKEKLGKYIREIQERNINSSNKNVLGISVSKKFISSRANREDLDVSKYKLLKKRQFGYVPVTSRNGNKISIAILNGSEGVISSTYIAFEVSDLQKLLPEYLYLWFSRSEFDRYARYHSWGSARETFNWSDMCEVELPLPSIKEQELIVSIHNVLEERKNINEKLKKYIKSICPVLCKRVHQKVL